MVITFDVRYHRRRCGRRHRCRGRRQRLLNRSVQRLLHQHWANVVDSDLTFGRKLRSRRQKVTRICDRAAIAWY